MCVCSYFPAVPVSHTPRNDQLIGRRQCTLIPVFALTFVCLIYAVAKEIGTSLHNI